jgi:hypothetical protein
MSYKLQVTSYKKRGKIEHLTPHTSHWNTARLTLNTGYGILHPSFCLLLFAFCFLPIVMQAQTIPLELFGEYDGDMQITNPTFGIDYTLLDIPVELLETGATNDFILKIPDFGIFDSLPIPIEMDSIQITAISNGYQLSRAKPITFIIPEITIPEGLPIPGGTYTDIPVKITLRDSKIIDYVLSLNIEVVVTITVVIIIPIPIPIPIPLNIDFEGTLFAPPVITTTTLPNGLVNEDYYALLEADGIKPVTWSMMSGKLPTGLELNEQTGAISGVPTIDSIFQFVVMATNMSGSSATMFSIEIVEEKDTTKIEELRVTRYELRVFPNPTKGELSIGMCDLKYEISDMRYEICDIEIFDVYGRTVSNLKPKISNLKIDISDFPAGIYFVKITTNSGVFTKKIVKE